MKEQINQLKQKFYFEVDKVKDLESLEKLEISFLGRKSGALTAVLRGLKDVAPEQKSEMGQLANQAKMELEAAIEDLRKKIKSKMESSYLDVTLPGNKLPEGHLHLVTNAIREISEIFERIGFQKRRYQEVDWDYYSFEALNMAPDHPARDEWETFFIDNEVISKKGQRVLTPHTSNGQVREMESYRPPIRMTNIGKCYRRQIDVSHVPMFHQFEGLVIDEGINITHLKGVLSHFFKEFYGEDRKYRIRPFHFQFTEPSFEVDISCGVCGGEGCRICKEGWLELGGAGMVHPNVLRAGKIDPEKYSGFAFGWGVERCYLMKADLSIPDIRMLYQNDLRFLKQF